MTTIAKAVKCVPQNWYGIHLVLDVGETIHDATRFAVDTTLPKKGFYHESIKFKIINATRIDVEFHDVQLPTVACPESPPESVQ